MKGEERKEKGDGDKRGKRGGEGEGRGEKGGRERARREGEKGRERR